MQGIRIIDNVVEVEVGVDTAAYAAGETLFQPHEVPLIVNQNGTAVIVSIVLADFDDQGIAMNLVFLRQVIGVGANQAAMTIADVDLHHVLGHVSIAATDYLNLPTNQIATVRRVGLELLPSPSARNSVWMAGSTAGAPTYAGGRLLFKIGVLRG